VTERDRHLAEPAIAWRNAERELQLLRALEPAEGQEWADETRAAHLEAAATGSSRFVSQRAFLLQLALLVVVLSAAIVRLTLRR
jgi:hypothetical protein